MVPLPGTRWSKTATRSVYGNPLLDDRWGDRRGQRPDPVASQLDAIDAMLTILESVKKDVEDLAKMLGYERDCVADDHSAATAAAERADHKQSTSTTASPSPSTEGIAATAAAAAEVNARFLKDEHFRCGDIYGPDPRCKTSAYQVYTLEEETEDTPVPKRETNEGFKAELSSRRQIPTTPTVQLPIIAGQFKVGEAEDIAKIRLQSILGDSQPATSKIHRLLQITPPWVAFTDFDLRTSRFSGVDVLIRIQGKGAWDGIVFKWVVMQKRGLLGSQLFPPILVFYN